MKTFLPALALMAVLLGLAACGPAGGTPAQKVSSWASGSGIVGLDATVAGDVKNFQGALKAHKQQTAQTLCGVLRDDVSQAYVELPSPDQQLTNLLDTAYLDLGQGADDCWTALGSPENRTLLTKAEHEIVAGSASLTSAGTRLASFGVSLTTGTGPT